MSKHAKHVLLYVVGAIFFAFAGVVVYQIFII
jgi:hypothetical protein